jgi:O-antigen/teichoic acid export membrane protein
MSNLARRWFGNSLVNLIGGLATAGANVLLPALVVKHLTVEEFSIWNLALQVVVYVNLLSLGMQTATARAVAHSAEQGGKGSESIPVIVRAARSIGYNAASFALLLVVVLVAGYPLLFPDISPALLSNFRLTLLLFGFSAVLQIPAQVDMGIFQGLHRNVIFVSVQIVIRLLTVFLVWIGVWFGQPMIALAILMASASSLLFPAIRLVFHRLVPWADLVQLAALNFDSRRDLLKYCGTLSVWSLSMLLVNSVGIIIVGRLDFAMVGAYSIAMTAATVVVGLLGAALSPLMTTAAALYASELTKLRLPQLLERSTLGLTIGLNLLVALLIVFHREILKFWIGENFAIMASPILMILVGAHCLRNVAAPYSLMLLATGLHRRAMMSAIIEGVTNLLASIVLGIMFGSAGVAIGSVVGAVVGVVGTLLLNTRRTHELTPRPLLFSFRAVLLPMLAFMPLHFYLMQIYV